MKTGDINNKNHRVGRHGTRFICRIKQKHIRNTNWQGQIQSKMTNTFSLICQNGRQFCLKRQGQASQKIKEKIPKMERNTYTIIRK